MVAPAASVTRRIALIVDAFAPARTSAAVQMRDLARELARLGHLPTIITPSPELSAEWIIEHDAGVEILRLKAPRTKDIGKLRRVLAEFVMPFVMWRALSRSPAADRFWDGIAWYSPSIFFGPLVRRLKSRSRCRAYLILRDLFPDWAVDAGIMRRGIAYHLLKRVEAFQYSMADVIGVQSPSNIPLVRAMVGSAKRVEVFDNWLSPVAAAAPGVDPDCRLAGKSVLVYAGNMGAAQGMDCLLDLAFALRERDDLAFLFVGRGSEAARMRRWVADRLLDRVYFLDEVEPHEVPGLLARCHVGLLALDPRHTSHNIPGKFLTYLRAGLPVLARVNPGNDLVAIIRGEGVGRVVDGQASPEELARLALELLSDQALRESMGARGRALADRRYSSASAACRLLGSLASSARNTNAQ